MYIPHAGSATKGLMQILLGNADWQPHSSGENKRAEKQRDGVVPRGTSRLEKEMPAGKLLRSYGKTAP